MLLDCHFYAASCLNGFVHMLHFLRVSKKFENTSKQGRRLRFGIDCSHKYKINQVVMVVGRQPLGKTTFGGRQPSVEDIKKHSYLAF